MEGKREALFLSWEEGEWRIRLSWPKSSRRSRSCLTTSGLWLIEQLVHGLRDPSRNAGPDFDAALAVMAADPQMQRELTQMARRVRLYRDGRIGAALIAISRGEIYFAQPEPSAWSRASGQSAGPCTLHRCNQSAPVGRDCRCWNEAPTLPATTRPMFACRLLRAAYRWKPCSYVFSSVRWTPRGSQVRRQADFPSPILPRSMMPSGTALACRALPAHLKPADGKVLSRMAISEPILR